MKAIKNKKRAGLRKLLIIAVIITLILVAIPVSFLVYNYYKDNKAVRAEIAGYTNDASHLNPTKIDRLIKVDANIDVTINQISLLIRQAKAEGKKISIAGAQHSMGGHTIYPDGIMLDMKSFRYMTLDSLKTSITVGSGALWSDIIPYLDSNKKSIAIMQSNNSFSVGGSISVNCHGWTPDAPPIASSVESFRLINADGEIITCSRKENTELFSLVLGGYGLFGVILDVKLKVADNTMYTARQHLINSADYVKAFDGYVGKTSGVGLAYGRININPDHFMDQAILTTFIEDKDAELKSLDKPGYSAIRRTVFRSSANSNFGKNLRWEAEKTGTTFLGGKKFSRNQLLNEGVETYQNTDSAYTDILHEYFIPGDSVTQFIEAVKLIIPSYDVDLLNITVRNVKADHDVFLRYANEDVFGFVMLYNQPRTAKGESEMKSLTQRLMDVAIALRGTYYLPYRLHATKAQMHRAYPMAAEFFRLKKKYDPLEVFRNQFYESYR